jgi:hypothetical protein
MRPRRQPTSAPTDRHSAPRVGSINQQGRDRDLSDHLILKYSPDPATLALNAIHPVDHSAPNWTHPWLIGGGAL